jgi:hypothetical protein
MDKTFLFNAHAHILGGFITRPPQKFVETAGAVALPITGGHQKTEISNYAFDPPHITIDYACAEVSSKQSAGGYDTSIATTIRGLAVSDESGIVITARGIQMNISTHHPGDDSETTVQISGSFDKLIVKNEEVIVVPDTMFSDAPTYSQFDQKFGNSSNVSKSKRPGMMRCSLHKKVTHSMALPHLDQQVLKVPNFGLIYLGEVHLQDSTRRVTMMRLELGSPTAGSIALGGGSGNGNTYP